MLSNASGSNLGHKTWRMSVKLLPDRALGGAQYQPWHTINAKKKTASSGRRSERLCTVNWSSERYHHSTEHCRLDCCWSCAIENQVVKLPRPGAAALLEAVDLSDHTAERVPCNQCPRPLNLCRASRGVMPLVTLGNEPQGFLCGAVRKQGDGCEPLSTGRDGAGTLQRALTVSNRKIRANNRKIRAKVES